ncbi:MAG: cysteine--tRNA ligase [Nanoarchaeota archaeon]|nr:cysteine--tRNA ligase [Nanoarchaeota archaeon]
MLVLFNTLGRKKEEFKPLEDKLVRLYTCGPTVYNYAHIGNFRSYVAQDILKRYLLYKGYSVKHVMNLTDVDDKTIRDSQKEGISLKEFTERYTKAFFEDSKKLNLLPADVYAKATEHIEDMRKLIQTLIDKGFAYKGEDNSIYYDVSKFKEYGKLSGIKVSELKVGARVKQDEYEKEEANDFALWKAWTPEDGDVFWNVKFTIDGKEETIRGRPGWHIECSAMSMKYLGETLDIHAGGVDLIFPHHENEIAQSEAATGKQFVRYWFHNEWVLVEGKKMSKRYNNFYTLRDVLAKGYSPKAVRYLLMNAHYRSQLNFTFEGLKDAETTVNRLIEFMEKLDEINEGIYNEKVKELIADAKKKFEEAMDDDLNVPLAMAAIHEFVSEINKLIADNKFGEKNAKEVKEVMLEFDKVLGILEHEKAEVPEEIKKLVEEREEARKKKDFRKADEIREKIREMGWELQDTPDGPKLRKRI